MGLGSADTSSRVSSVLCFMPPRVGQLEKQISKIEGQMNNSKHHQ